MSTDVERLYHFTCAHSKRKIGTSNCLLIPQIRHPLLGCKVTWLTTEPDPDRYSTGLGNYTGLNKCDRMEFRYVVTDLSHCRRWLASLERQAAPNNIVSHIESDGDAEHWWITDRPLRAMFDRTWRTHR
jgi:hypothetical protein